MEKLTKKEKRRWLKKLNKLRKAWLEAEAEKKALNKKYRKAWKKLKAKLDPLKMDCKKVCKKATKRHKIYKKARKIWRKKMEPKSKPEIATKMSTPPPAANAGVKDVLRKIEGIGPKIEQLLFDAGITTFAHLAKAQINAIKEILAAAGSRYRMHNPSSWPQQAQLAADNNWEELKILQDRLKGGRD